MLPMKSSCKKVKNVNENGLNGLIKSEYMFLAWNSPLRDNRIEAGTVNYEKYVDIRSLIFQIVNCFMQPHRDSILCRPVSAIRESKRIKTRGKRD